MSHHKNNIQDVRSIPKYYEIALKKNGYFDEQGVLRKEFILDYSVTVAKKLCNTSPRMTSTQLRNYYHHVKAACATFQKNRTLDNDVAERVLQNEILALKAKVKSCRGKNIQKGDSSLPKAFEEFIDDNLSVIEKNPDKRLVAKAIAEGFLPHFECIVGYFKYYEPKRR